MDLNKLVKQIETLADKAVAALDGKDANSVWSTATRVGGTEVGTISRNDLEFLIEAAESHDVPVIKRYAKTLREKYLGTDTKA